MLLLAQLYDWFRLRLFFLIFVLLVFSFLNKANKNYIFFAYLLQLSIAFNRLFEKCFEPYENRDEEVVNIARSKDNKRMKKKL